MREKQPVRSWGFLSTSWSHRADTSRHGIGRVASLSAIQHWSCRRARRIISPWKGSGLPSSFYDLETNAPGRVCHNRT
jgi:hypothetical protein